MKVPIMAIVAMAFFSLAHNPAKSQGLLNKIKKQTEQKVLKKTDDTLDDVLFGDKNKDTENQNSTSGSESGNSSSGMSNTTGSGLVNTPPDVLKNINDADQAFSANNYSAAKYAVRQAMLGIEMEIGHKILEALPETVDGLNAAKEKDNVTSMSYGFVGLTMERIYEGSNKELKLNIGNNSALLGAVNIMLGSGAYATSSDQNYKQTMFKGYKSVLQFDSSSGYTLSVPFGQSSIFVLNGINYASEDEIMKAAENFDIESIKQELGEK